MGILRWLFGCNCQTCKQTHDKYYWPISRTGGIGGYQPLSSDKPRNPPPKKP